MVKLELVFVKEWKLLSSRHALYDLSQFQATFLSSIWLIWLSSLRLNWPPNWSSDGGEECLTFTKFLSAIIRLSLLSRFPKITPSFLASVPAQRGKQSAWKGPGDTMCHVEWKYVGQVNWATATVFTPPPFITTDMNEGNVGRKLFHLKLHDHSFCSDVAS